MEKAFGKISTIYSSYYILKFKKVSNHIIDSMKLRNSQIEIGLDGKFIPYKLNRFLSEDINTVYDTKESKVLFGVIGAIIGAFIGSILWVILAKVGYAVGVVGYAMLILAAMGYRICSGFLNNYGQKISVWIVCIVILIVHPISYLLDSFTYYGLDYTLNNGIHLFCNLPSYLNETENWIYFITNLIMGYMVFLLVSYRAIREIFHKNK